MLRCFFREHTKKFRIKALSVDAMELDEHVVMDYYLELIREEKIQFLKDKPKTTENIISAIKKLKSADSLHERIQCARDLWKLLFEAAMEYIDPNKMGYDELFKYFDEFVSFEELIFASDSFYRDHTLHSLWVYFLGEYIFRRDEFRPYFENFYQSFQVREHYKEIYTQLDSEEIFGELLDTIENMDPFVSSIGAARCITALTHDLGYPLNKIRKINQAIGKILPYFSISQFGEFHFQFESSQQFYIENFIEIMGYDVFVGPRERDLGFHQYELVKDIIAKTNELTTIAHSEGRIPDFLSEVKELVKECSPEQVHILRDLYQISCWFRKNTARMMRFSDDFERYAHGIMSAFLMMKIVGAFTDMTITYSNISDIPMDIFDLPRTFAKMQILTAISNHTSRGYRMREFNDLSSFLVLIDEIEEFSRISRANQFRQYVEEFCRTKIYVEDEFMVIEFIFDNEDIESLDPERAFKGRIRRFGQLFDIPNLDPAVKMKIAVISELKGEKTRFELFIERGRFEARRNGETISIDTYLKTREL
ncbi:MAG: hypothetical protein BAJATHORv1_20029 [Candidatus Thorarchaeota archaeon]|nr:MAG: hypothetical protein BAJATHORv1_20029 [Candidatus Thorarchaeota archaeon]